MGKAPMTGTAASTTTEPQPTAPGNGVTAPPEAQRTYSEEEVQRRMRGPGKRIAELEAELEARGARLAELSQAQEAHQRKAAEEQGKFKELFEQSDAARKTIEEQFRAAQEKVKALEGREAARLEALQARNEERLKALPEALQALVPEGLTPDQAEAQLAKLEALGGQQKAVQVYSGGVRAPVRQSPEAKAEAHARAGLDWMMGRKGADR